MEKEQEQAFATNEYDVKIAEIKAEIERYQLEIGSEIMKVRENGKWKTQRLEKITSSTERVLLGGLVLAGVMYVTDKRHDLMDTIFEGDE